MSRLSRRRFVAGAGAAGLGLLAGCGRWSGQGEAPTRVPRIGYLASDPPARWHEAFRQGLRDLGYQEGQNLAVEYRWAEIVEQYGELATGLIGLPVDILVAAGGTDSGLAARQATNRVPIVLAYTPDPVATGLVASLARPDGNVTGLSIMSPHLNGKRIELLQGVLPQVSRVALLFGSGPAGLVTQREAQAAARVLGIELLPLRVGEASDVGGALAEAVRWQTNALWADGSPLVTGLRADIVGFAAKHQLPVLGQAREYTEVGGLMSYGASRTATYYRAAYYVDRILKGTNPADLPVEQPMTFDFVVNMKTARELGVTFPPEIMLQVTEVIE